MLVDILWFTGYDAPRAVFPSSVPYVARDARHHGRFGPQGQLCSGMCKAWLSDIFLLAMCSSCGPDALHHGRCGPEGQLCFESWPRSCLRKASIVCLCRGSRARVRGISMGSDWWLQCRKLRIFRSFSSPTRSSSSLSGCRGRFLWS